jgi:anti-repressor protein
MNELIKVDSQMMVDAKELHLFLQVGTRWDKWIQRRIEEYGFVQAIDFVVVKNDLNDYTGFRMSLDMAKEICMVERNAKGKEARQYFIAIEKAWQSREQKSPGTSLEVLQATVNALVDQERRVKTLETRQDIVEEKMLLLASDSDYRTVRGWARINGISISEKEAAMVGKKTGSICRQKGLHIGKVPDERHGVVNSYPVHMLKSVMDAWRNGVI